MVAIIDSDANRTGHGVGVGRLIKFTGAGSLLTGDLFATDGGSLSNSRIVRINPNTGAVTTSETEWNFTVAPEKAAEMFLKRFRLLGGDRG